MGDGERANLETSETLDSTYLAEALEALLEAGDPDALYAGTVDAADDPAKEAFNSATVRLRQMRACRQATLYSAFAAEAFINSFIAATLNRRDRKLIDRNEVMQKYVLGPRLALNAADLSELEVSDERNVLKRLFTLRNKLVHPRPRELDEIKAKGAEWRFNEYGPSKAAEFVAAVGSEAYTLSQLHDAMPLSRTAYVVVLGRERIVEFGKTAETVPERGAGQALTMDDLEQILTERVLGT